MVHLREVGQGSLQVQMSLGSGAQTHPDQCSARGVPRLGSTAALSGSSIAAPFTPYTCFKTKTEVNNFVLA